MISVKFLPRFAAFACVALVAWNSLAQEPLDNATSANSDGLRQRITNDLQKWDSIADHRTGTEGDNATAEWLADEIRAVGLEPHLDRFDFHRRVLKECTVVIGETRIEGVPLFDGGFTGVEPIRAKLGQPDVPGTITFTHYTAVKTDERYEETR